MKSRALRGVNLGGWLIVEQWMTPSLFRDLDAHDEYTLSSSDEGKRRITQHRRDFIQESDFAWLAEHEVELVRIPFGYWLFGEDDAYVGGFEQLDWAMEMADKYDIKVLLDFHAHPGSQNGQDHSGRQGDDTWYRDSRHRRQSIEYCERAAQRYEHSSALWGFEVINEPNLSWLRYFKLRMYYTRVYKKLADVLPDDVYMVYSDAFKPKLLNGALWPNRRQKVVMDIHYYSFGENWTRLRSLVAYYQKLEKRVELLRKLQRAQPVIVGEWSGVLPKEATTHLPQDDRAHAEYEHIHKQLVVYEETTAHIYWSYKTEHDGAWNYRFLSEKGVIKGSDSATLR